MPPDTKKSPGTARSQLVVAALIVTRIIRPRIFGFRIVGGFNNFLLSGRGRVHIPNPQSSEMLYGAFFVGR